MCQPAGTRLAARVLKVVSNALCSACWDVNSRLASTMCNTSVASRLALPILGKPTYSVKQCMPKNVLVDAPLTVDQARCNSCCKPSHAGRLLLQQQALRQQALPLSAPTAPSWEGLRRRTAFDMPCRRVQAGGCGAAIQPRTRLLRARALLPGARRLCVGGPQKMA